MTQTFPSLRKNVENIYNLMVKMGEKPEPIACLLICTENVNSTKTTNNFTIESTSASSGSTCQCTCIELLIEVESIKLDQVMKEVSSAIAV